MKVRTKCDVNALKEDLFKVIDPRLDWSFEVELIGQGVEEVDRKIWEHWMLGTYEELYSFKRKFINNCNEYYKCEKTSVLRAFLRQISIEDIFELNTVQLAFPPRIKLEKTQEGIEIKDREALDKELELVFEEHFRFLFI